METTPQASPGATTKKKTRRTWSEVAALAKRAMALQAQGMGYDKAIDKVGLARSVFDRAKKKLKANGSGQHGRVDVRSLPPRPKKGKKHGGDRRSKKGVDVSSVSSLAARIMAIDKRLAKVRGLQVERRELSAHLMKILRRG